MSTGITPPPSPAQPPGEGQKKPFWKKKRFIIPAAIVAFFILMSAISGGQRTNNQALPEVTASPASPVDTAPAPAPAQPAPATPAPAPPPPAAPGVGEAVTVDQGDGNVAKVTIMGAKYAQEAGQFMGAPDNGGYLILDVMWETQTGTTKVNPLYFNAKSSEGRQGGAGLGVDGQIGTGDVPAGDLLRGNVASDVGPGPWIVTVNSPGFQEVARFRVVLP